MTPFDQSIADLDVSIFQVQSQTTIPDRRSLLAIQDVVRRRTNPYVYLECGSHVGGSLLPHLLDPRCRLAYSVDKRPAIQPDERGMNYDYPGNSSQRMIEALSSHATADSMAKLRVFDMDAYALTADKVQEKPDLVLIDAEHTNTAVFSDFLSLYRLCHDSTVYAFHDANLICSGLQNIERFLHHSGVAFESHVLLDVVYVLATNQAREMLRPIGQRFGLNKRQFAEAARQQIMMYHHDIVKRIYAQQQQQPS